MHVLKLFHPGANAPFYAQRTTLAPQIGEVVTVQGAVYQVAHRSYAFGLAAPLQATNTHDTMCNLTVVRVDQPMEG